MGLASTWTFLTSLSRCKSSELKVSTFPPWGGLHCTAIQSTISDNISYRTSQLPLLNTLELAFQAAVQLRSPSLISFRVFLLHNPPPPFLSHDKSFPSFESLLQGLGKIGRPHYRERCDFYFKPLHFFNLSATNTPSKYTHDVPLPRGSAAAAAPMPRPSRTLRRGLLQGPGHQQVRLRP